MHARTPQLGSTARRSGPCAPCRGHAGCVAGATWPADQARGAKRPGSTSAHLLQARDGGLVDHRVDELQVGPAVVQQVAAAVAHVVLGALHVVCGGRERGQQGTRALARVGGGKLRASTVHVALGGTLGVSQACCNLRLLAGLDGAAPAGLHGAAPAGLPGTTHSPCRSQKAISGSIIQNSARWRAVWLFSARKVGPASGGPTKSGY